MAETLANYTVPEHHIKMYTNNVQMALTKQGGSLRAYVSQGAYMGEKAQVVNFIGSVEFVERTTYFADTKYSDIEHTQKWIAGTEYDVAVPVDRLDTLKMIYEPTSPYVEAVRAGAARKEDEIIMSRFYTDVRTGKDGNTMSAFPAGNIVAHGATGLTVAKLRSLRKLIKKRHNDLRAIKPYIAITADEADDLLGEVAVGSSDYNAVKPLVDGEVNSFMGFIFVPFEDNGDVDLVNGKGIPFDKVNLVRKCPVWVPTGMHYGTWSGLEIKIAELPQKNHTKHIFGTFTAGATRLEEGRVFQCEVKR